MTFDPAAAKTAAAAAIDQLATEHAADVAAAVAAATDPLVAQHAADQATIADLRAQLAAQHPPVSSPTITTDMVVRATFHDGVLPPREPGSIFVANEQPLAIAHARKSPRDWEKGSALHAAARPDPATGAPWHGAPWDWTTPADGLVTDYQYVNLWHELSAYATTGLPPFVRVQYRNVNLWTIAPPFTAWDKRLGVGAIAGGQTSSGAPGGGYFETTPIYQKHKFADGSSADIMGWPASQAPKRRTEPSERGGGWSLSLDPMRDSSGHLIDYMGILHGPFTNTDSPDRIKVPAGGYVCYSGEARLIMDDYSPVPAGAKFVATIGSDIFRAQTAAGDPPSQRATSQCNPRHMVLPTDGSWAGLVFCSGSVAMIRESFPALPFVNA